MPKHQKGLAAAFRHERHAAPHLAAGKATLPMYALENRKENA